MPHSDSLAVEPAAVADAGRRVRREADGLHGAGLAVGAALTALGEAAGHPGVATAASGAAGRWRTAGQQLAAATADLGDAAVTAAARYASVDGGLLR